MVLGILPVDITLSVSVAGGTWEHKGALVLVPTLEETLAIGGEDTEGGKKCVSHDEVEQCSAM